MRKETMITRTCETTYVNVKCFDTVNNCVTDKTVVLWGRVDTSTEKGIEQVKDSLKSSDTPYLVFILINSTEVEEEIRGMSLKDFMIHSEPVKR